jgi:hypothetical protein
MLQDPSIAAAQFSPVRSVGKIPDNQTQFLGRCFLHPFFKLIPTLIRVIGHRLPLAAKNIDEQLKISARSWQMKTATTLLVYGNPERLFVAFNHIIETGFTR